MLVAEVPGSRTLAGLHFFLLSFALFALFLSRLCVAAYLSDDLWQV